MKVQVDCYAGYRGDQRPLRFTLAGRCYEVREITDQWYSPGAYYLRVVAEDGNLYVLRHEEGPGEEGWTLEAYRQVSGRTGMSTPP